jgi:hypothetical protein
MITETVYFVKFWKLKKTLTDHGSYLSISEQNGSYLYKACVVIGAA